MKHVPCSQKVNLPSREEVMMDLLENIRLQAQAFINEHESATSGGPMRANGLKYAGETISEMIDSRMSAIGITLNPEDAYR